MFDYIKLDEGTFRLFVCVIILFVFWLLMISRKKTTFSFNIVMVYVTIGFVSAILFYCLSQNQWYYFESSDINYEPLLYLSLIHI